MGVQAQPVTVFGPHVLRRVILLMDVQQRSLRQGEQHYRAQDHCKPKSHGFYSKPQLLCFAPG